MDPYEDPRIPIEERIDDLLSQMTLEEEAGMLFINGAAVNADGSIEDNPDQPGFAIGTGIGGGLVVNGQLHLGIGGTGGELGHTVIDFNGPRCGWGNYGCLEAYASAPAISAIDRAVSSSLGERRRSVNYCLSPSAVLCANVSPSCPLIRWKSSGHNSGTTLASLVWLAGPRRCYEPFCVRRAII